MTTTHRGNEAPRKSPNIPLCLSVSSPVCGVRRWRLEKLSRDVEPDVPVVGVGSAARQLGHRGPDAVREIELEDVAASALLDAERRVGDIGIVANPRDDLANEIDGRPNANARTEAQEECVVVV